MTDEEKIKKAKGIICKNCKWNECDNNACPTLQETIEAIELGLAEGRKEKWHDLRKDPSDLPKTTKLYYCCATYNYSKIYEHHIYEIKTNHFVGELGKIIAWCELPEFKE